MAYCVVTVIVNRQDNRRTYAIASGVPRLMTHFEVVTSEPFGLHEVHAACAPFAAFGRDFHWVSDYAPCRPAACLDGGEDLANRPFHHDVNFSLGRCA